MHRREPLAKKGVAGMDTSAQKNILTRRANQGHNSIIPKSVRPPMRCLSGSRRDNRPNILIIEMTWVVRRMIAYALQAVAMRLTSGKPQSSFSMLQKG